MKAKWIDDVAAIVKSKAFDAWLVRLEQSRKSLKSAEDRVDELLTQVNLLEFRAELAHRRAIDTLERSNELDDHSARLANRAAELENQSFEVVSQFEMQRARCTDLWERLGAIDVEIEEGKSDSGKLTRQREKLNFDYEREDKRKQRLWQEVEDLWVRGIDQHLALHEKRHKARLVRQEAESLFSRYDQEAELAAQLRRDVERVQSERALRSAELQAIYEEAREQFECLLNDDFLYWSSQEDNKWVYATPLVADQTNYVVPLQLQQLYRCPVQGGVDALAEVDWVTVDSAARGESVEPPPSEPGTEDAAATQPAAASEKA